MLLAIGVQCSSGSQQFSACHNNHSVSPTHFQTFVETEGSRPGIRALYEWCSADTHCSEAYYLLERTGDKEPAKRFDAFRFLVTRWTADGEVRSTGQLFERELCSHTSLEALTRRLWMLELRARAYENTRSRCASNEKFIFSPATLEGHCVCLGNRNCDASSVSNTADGVLSRRVSTMLDEHQRTNSTDESPWNNSVITVVITFYIIGAMVIMQIVEMYWKVRTFQRIERSSDSATLRQQFSDAAIGRR